MTNLCVSSVCDMACPFCFAESFIQERRNGRQAFIALKEYEKRLDFLLGHGIDTARLIGGEPTLHPEFGRLLTLARESSLKIAVFSHGLIREKALQALLDQPPQLCTVMINMNATRGKISPTEGEREWRTAVLRRLGPRARAGYTIWRADFDLRPLFDTIIESGCGRTLRLGLAQPTVSGESRYLHPRRYAFAGQRIAEFAEAAAARGIRLEFDCGFVPCMFDQEGRALLAKSEAKVGWHCSPILDIGLEHEVMHCFPLTGLLQTDFDCGRSRSEIYDHLSRQAGLYRSAGLFRRCRDCRYRAQGICSGGCLAHTVRRMHYEPVHFTLA